MGFLEHVRGNITIRMLPRQRIKDIIEHFNDVQKRWIKELKKKGFKPTRAYLVTPPSWSSQKNKRKYMLVICTDDGCDMTDGHFQRTSRSDDPFIIMAIWCYHYYPLLEIPRFYMVYFEKRAPLLKYLEKARKRTKVKK